MIVSYADLSPSKSAGRFVDLETESGKIAEVVPRDRSASIWTSVLE